MIARFCHYPATCKPEDVLQQVHDEQYTNWFYTDVMARGYYPEYMDRYFEEKNIHIQMEPGDEEILKENTVDWVLPLLFLYTILNLIQNGKKKTEV